MQKGQITHLFHSKTSGVCSEGSFTFVNFARRTEEKNAKTRTQSLPKKEESSWTITLIKMTPNSLPFTVCQRRCSQKKNTRHSPLIPKCCTAFYWIGWACPSRTAGSTGKVGSTSSLPFSRHRSYWASVTKKYAGFLQSCPPPISLSGSVRDRARQASFIWRNFYDFRKSEVLKSGKQKQVRRNRVNLSPEIITISLIYVYLKKGRKRLKMRSRGYPFP